MDKARGNGDEGPHRRCEERSDEAIHGAAAPWHRLLRFARNDVADNLGGVAVTVHKEISFEDAICVHPGANGWVSEANAPAAYDRTRALSAPHAEGARNPLSHRERGRGEGTLRRRKGDDGQAHGASTERAGYLTHNRSTERASPLTPAPLLTERGGVAMTSKRRQFARARASK
jgi:hypothetical protein